MPISRRRFLSGAAAGVGSAVLAPAMAACGGDVQARIATGPPSAATRADLTVWGFSGAIEGLQSVLPAFRRRYPHVNVQVQVLDYDTIHTNLLNALVSETGAPDLASIDCSYLASYVDGLVDLSARRAEVGGEFVPPVIELSSYREKFYGLVTDSEPIAMAYRKDIWDQHGIREEDVRTWSALADAADHLYSDSGGRISMYPLLESETANYEVLAAEQGFGGFFFDRQDRRVVVGEPKIVDAVASLQRLWGSKGAYRNPANGYVGDEVIALLKKGTIASQIVCPGWFPQNLKQNLPEQAGRWRLMRVPAIAPGGPRVGYQYPTIFVIPQQSRVPELAWELQVMGLTEQGARHLWDTQHVLPAWMPLFEELQGQGDAFFGGQRVFTLWNEIARDCPPIGFGNEFKEAQNIMGQFLTDILNGSRPRADGMKAAAANLRLKLHKD